MEYEDFNDFYQQTLGMSLDERIDRAELFQEYLIIGLESVNSTSADGVSISRDLKAVESLINLLKVRKANCSGWIWQNRISR